MDDKDQIKLLYQQMYRAMIDKDVAVLDSIMDEGCFLVHMTGTRQPKREYLREIVAGTLNYFSVADDSISVSIEGDEAELVGQSRVEAAVYGGGRHTWRLQIASKLRKRDGRWLFTEQRASTY